MRMRRSPSVLCVMRGGGLSSACACDLRVCGESFKMQAGHLDIGLTGTDMSGPTTSRAGRATLALLEALMTARRALAQKS